MPRLHQILPVLKSAQDTTSRALDEARRGLANGNALSGFSKTYRPKDEEGDRLPSESKRVQYTAPEILTLVGASLARLFDIVAVKEFANTQAKADVVVNGTTLVHDAPVSYLLFLEKQVGEMLALVSTLPTLDPAMSWSRDETTAGQWKTEPVETVRTRKITDFVIAAPATDKHPAQVREVSRDDLAGYWELVNFSGALPASQVQAMQGRLYALREAVLHAREQANSVEAAPQDPGAAVMAFVFGV